VAINEEIIHVIFRGLIDAFVLCPKRAKYWRLNVHEVVEAWYETTQPNWFAKHILWREDKEVNYHQN
jgi:hypothetical protein